MSAFAFINSIIYIVELISLSNSQSDLRQSFIERNKADPSVIISYGNYGLYLFMTIFESICIFMVTILYVIYFIGNDSASARRKLIKVIYLWMAYDFSDGIKLVIYSTNI